MSSRPRKSRRPWSWVLTWGLTWRRSWTSWRLRRTRRKLQRAEKRELLLLLSLDSTRLEQKELLQHQQMLQNRLQEMAEARQFRLTGSLPEPTPPSSLDRALGL